MAGEGFMQHAAISLRNNRSLSRKSNFFKKEKSLFIRGKEYVEEEKSEFDFKKVSKKDLRIIKEKIVGKAKKRQRIELFLFTISIIFTFFLAIVFYNNQIAAEPTIRVSKEESYKLTNIEKYNFLISSGDNSLRNKRYYNAIDEYKLALALFPKDSIATYRLLSAFDMRCQKYKIECDKVDILLEELSK